jgi:hypothetical protein
LRSNGSAVRTTTDAPFCPGSRWLCLHGAIGRRLGKDVAQEGHTLGVIRQRISCETRHRNLLMCIRRSRSA